MQLVRPAEEDKAAADVLLKLSNAIGGRVKFKPITSEEFLQGLRDLGYESLANFEPMSKAVQKQPLKDSTNTPTKGKSGYAGSVLQQLGIMGWARRPGYRRRRRCVFRLGLLTAGGEE